MCNYRCADELWLNEYGGVKVDSDSAIIFGSGGGIGAALERELSARPRYGRIEGLSRHSMPAIDLLSEESIASAAAALAADCLCPSLIIIATGILHNGSNGPEKSLRELDPEWMIENYRLNAIGPAIIAKHFLPLMPRKGRICLAVLSARVGSISDNNLGGWHSYRASKAALNMLVRNISIEWQRKNPDAIIVGLHPGTVETTLSAPFKGNPAHERFAAADAAKQLLAVLDGLNPAQSGQLLAYDGSIIAP
jgi:NAD(P)-dependent dehydrogenase (short-subunit alcohol dehydrogenase family)